MSHPNFNPQQYPTLGVDFDNAGFSGNPAPASSTPSTDDGGGVGIAVGAAVAIGQQARPERVSRSLPVAITSKPVTMQARFINGTGQGNNPATTYTFMVFPEVTPNHVHEIMRIGVTAPDPFTSLSGVTILAFRNSFVPQDSNTEPSIFGDLIAVLGAVPNTSYPSWRSTICRASERVVLAFKGLANSQVMLATMDVIEHDLDCYLRGLLNS